jgi:hypothetical protein
MSENNRLSEDGDAGYGKWRQDTEEVRRAHVLLPFTFGRMLITMWRSLFIVFLLAGMGARSSAESVDYRDFAINTYYPKPSEVRVAEERTRQYWAKSAGRYGSHPVYLAVETSKVFESESVQNLYAKLLYSETRDSFFGRSVGRHRGRVDLKGIMILDIRTGRFVSARGYVCVDTPPRGRVARFGSYIARYIDTGRGSYFRSAGFARHNFGNFSYAPSAEQRAIAQRRVHLYFVAVREGRRPAATHRYIAVETLRPTREWLEANLNKRTVVRMAQPLARMAEIARLHWLMMFDTQTQEFVGSRMYAVDSLPAVGQLMRFDTMSAEFVGQGEAKSR